MQTSWESRHCSKFMEQRKIDEEAAYEEDKRRIKDGCN